MSNFIKQIKKNNITLNIYYIFVRTTFVTAYVNTIKKSCHNSY